MPEEVLFRKDLVQAYEDGKHRRYGLLFSVNGGALAVGQLAAAGSTADKLVLGGLRVWMLGLAMATFSLVMTYDIWQFGSRMRKVDSALFTASGKAVLLLIGSLLTLVALIVAIPQNP